MAFVNENVSHEDAEKFDLDGITKKFGGSIGPRYQWTIDRNKNVFLKWISAEREEFSNRQNFVLYWKGGVIPISLEKETIGNYSDGAKTLWTSKGIDLPGELERSRDEIVSALKEALTEYKVFGLGVDALNHSAYFNF
jgi:hypothetical protein